MWAVTQKFEDAIAAPHELVTELSVTVPGGVAYPLRLKTGSVSGSATARIRRTCDLVIFGTSVEYDLISTPGARFDILHGVSYGGNDTELVPVFAGEMVDGSQGLGDGVITFSGGDLAQRLSRCNFLFPYTLPSLTTRPAAIAAIVSSAMPEVDIVNSASDAGTIGVQVWTGSRLDAITQLCSDGGMDAYFNQAGQFVIRDQVTLNDPPVWAINAGDGGTLKTLNRDRPSDKLYNAVIVSPQAADGSQKWTPQVAYLDDTTNPLHENYIGLAPLPVDSATAKTGAEAMNIARAKIGRAHV